jgi:hypothetical protein
MTPQEKIGGIDYDKKGDKDQRVEEHISLSQKFRLFFSRGHTKLRPFGPAFYYRHDMQFFMFLIYKTMGKPPPAASPLCHAIYRLYLAIGRQMSGITGSGHFGQGTDKKSTFKFKFFF